MNPETLFILGFFFALALVGACWLIVWTLNRRFEQKITSEVSAAESRISTEIRQRLLALDDLAENLKHKSQKNIAKSQNKSQNKTDSQGVPFWNSKEKIKEALEKADKGDFEMFAEFSELVGATPMENYHALDERLLELQVTTEDLPEV